MRKALMIALLLATAACGSQPSETSRSQSDLKTFDAAETPSNGRSAASPPPSPVSPPSIGPTAAPGVAFNYQYAFRLPAARISAVQEQHAQACEKLGIDKCRITGMRYELTGEDRVEAQLAFKLDPALARRFGREGIDSVVRAEGLLTRAEITGEDVGTQIEQGERGQGNLQDELRRIEQQLARGNLSAGERVELQQQADRLRESLRSGAEAQTQRRQQLATTPMIFNYEAGDTDRSVGAGVRRGLDAFVRSLGALLVVLVYLAPWILTALLALLLFRWARRRFASKAVAPVEPISPPEA